MQLHFEWDSVKAARNLLKHEVSFVDATDVFRDPLALTLYDVDHSNGEDRWVTLGKVKTLRLVVVIHTWQEQDDEVIHVRIISAREATVQEMKQYEG
ncbi:MAG TPA: BrnT family toxin [Candidatus Acidoferrum sp.]|nr:BrnT family toxin [Candidatus Acidoferrum sp.]